MQEKKPLTPRGGIEYTPLPSCIARRTGVGEADALTDPTGLGAFRVLEWQVD